MLSWFLPWFPRKPRHLKIKKINKTQINANTVVQNPKLFCPGFRGNQGAFVICYVELACVSDFHWICPGFRGNQGKSYMQICCCRCLGNFKVECVPGLALFFSKCFSLKKIAENQAKSNQLCAATLLLVQKK